MTNMDLEIQSMFFKQRLTLLGLSNVWAYVSDTNLSGDLPYHNNQHLFHVARLANQLYRSGWDYNRDRERELIVAALFHDYDHSGGEWPDRLNIQRAQLNASEYLIRHPSYGISAKAVSDLIAVTEFPFQVEPTNDLERCLRDADLLYSFSEDTIPDIMDGLRSEMERSTQSEITVTEFAAAQERFINNMVFYTPFARNVWSVMKADLLKKQVDYSRRVTA